MGFLAMRMVANPASICYHKAITKAIEYQYIRDCWHKSFPNSCNKLLIQCVESVHNDIYCRVHSYQSCLNKPLSMSCDSLFHLGWCESSFRLWWGSRKWKLLGKCTVLCTISHLTTVHWTWSTKEIEVFFFLFSICWCIAATDKWLWVGGKQKIWCVWDQVKCESKTESTTTLQFQPQTESFGLLCGK